jgi:hypothetical protein
MISRTPLLTHLPLTGQYRYRDVLQLIPAKPEDPRPDTAHGWYGATLAVAFDDRIAPTRTVDQWAYDHRERARIQFLSSRVAAGVGSQDWLNSATSIQASFFRRRAIEHEAVRLLQVLTNNTLRFPSNTGHAWYLDRTSGEPVYGQGWYPSFVTDQWGEFWAGEAEAIPIVDTAQHFGRRGVGVGDVVNLPCKLEIWLDAYFATPPRERITFARACELFVNGQEIWPISRSLSLVSYVFSIDALCHADDPEPERCKECQNLRSEHTCAACGGPRFGLTRRFKAFVERYVGEHWERTFATQLFHVRSDIAHRGELLRADEFDAGFNVGGSDDQSDHERGVGQTVRKILLGWLEARRATASTGPLRQ